MNSLSRSALFLGLLGALPLAACNVQFGESGGSEEETAGELRRRQPIRVRATPAVRREMVRTLTTSREVESEHQIEVFPRAAGVVEEVHVEEGDRVEKGAVLAVLDQRNALASVEDAEIALAEAKDNIDKTAIATREADALVAGRLLTFEQAKRDYERNEKTGLISQQELDKLRVARDSALSEHAQAELALDRARFDEKAAQTAVERAEVALDQARLELSYTTVSAPIAGVIAKRSIKIGDSVSNAAAAFTLTDHESLIVVFPRPQRELPVFSREVRGYLNGESGFEDVAPELEITATAEALPGASFSGEIRRISPAIDPENGSFRVTAHLEQPELGSGRPRLLPGMLVELSIVTERHPDALVVPKRALRREGDVDLLFCVREGLARRVEVKSGFSDDDDVEIFPLPGQALEEGDAVIFVGNRDLEDGAEVEAELWRDGVRIDEPAPPPTGDAAEEEEAVAAETASGEE